MLDLIIIGGGPAGISAAIYGKRAGLDLVLIEKGHMLGGQVLNTYEVDNYPGLPGISGVELSKAWREHADKLGVDFVYQNVSSVARNNGSIEVITDGEIYKARTVIIATGAVHNTLNVPGENELRGAGVSYCATCDGAFFNDMTVAVVGGGDSALEDALYLAKTCKKVFIIHRRNSFRADAVLWKQAMACDNIKIIWNSVVSEIKGNGIVESIMLQDSQADETKELSVDGVFVAIGMRPATDNMQLPCSKDEHGYIVADESCVTDVEGVYAAGDVRTKMTRQIVTAASDGSNAIRSVKHYLQIIQ